jgi:hypothetical protein
MSTLTHLSDVELDAVTGGYFFPPIKIDANIALVSTEQANVAYYNFKAYQSNSSAVVIYQHA